MGSSSLPTRAGAIVLALFVLAGSSAPPIRAAPASAPAGVCEVETIKTARPPRIVLGEQVEITLRLAGRCPDVTTGGEADIVLALDRSASQRDNGTWTATVEAATAFVELIDFDRHQVAVLTFSGGGILGPKTVTRQPLTTDRAAAVAAVAGIPEPPAITFSTDLTAAVEASQAELTSARARPDAQPVILLLSDGAHNDLFSRSPTVAAQEVKDAGSLIITIGLGVDTVAAETLRQMASREGLYFPAPSASDLEGVYREIAGTVGGSGRITALEIVDLLTPEVAYVTGSAVPPPSAVTASQLTWTLAELPAEGWTATYRVTPLVVGTYSTNKLAFVDYIDGDGSIATANFPKPEITVLEPGANAAFLPVIYRHFCRPAKPFDIALVLDTSSSMWGEKLDRTREAARDFLSLLQMPPSRAAVIAFNERPTVVQGLTDSRALAQAALDRLPQDPGSRIDRAVLEAVGVLEASGDRSGRAPVIVLITDGRQVGGSDQDALNAGAAARRAGIAVYAIGFGPDVDPDLLTRIAGSPERFYNAPTVGDLIGIYRQIAGTLPCDFGR